ncbi:uncharacterized protein LOC114795782 [Denticeps clupeoides]|uniref:PHD-type domain-containing protein n=1 Tax=Denticeps clupeoides TaxID=299321 RepID=A0AAY4BV07_9TELE|nr:uncharacterized protein LOC114795782 [Denticeps clupeoides]
MDQQSSTSDGLHPQDLSSSCIPVVYDLSRRSEECLLKGGAVEALHAAQPPGWYVCDGGGEAMVFPQNDCDLIPFPSQQIQPDDGFCSSTVTLSYVSRSHVFTSSGVPPHLVDRDLAAEDGHQPHQQASAPATLPAEVVQRVAVCYLTHAQNVQQEDPQQNGLCGLISMGPPGRENVSDSELGLLVSFTEEPALHHRASAVAFPFSPEYGGALEDPAPLDDAEDAFQLPQAAASPSGDGFADSGVTEPARTGVEQPSNCHVADVHPAEVPDSDPDPQCPAGGQAPARDEPFERKKLPARSGRGMRLEAIVHNIHPSWFRARACAFTRKPRRPKPQAKEQGRLNSCGGQKKTGGGLQESASLEEVPEGPSSRRSGIGSPVTPPATKPRRRPRAGRASYLAVQEPELKLKCLNERRGRREPRVENFSPFVRVEVRGNATCTVVNHPEESPSRPGQQAPFPRLLCAAAPSASCVQYGRVSAASSRRGALVCSLCGASANAPDLGDLHGPYYAEGFRPPSEPSPDSPRDDGSDSDSSSRGKRPSLAREMMQADAGRPWSAAMMDGWFRPPVVPLLPAEYWLHEDCAVWSAGVFLVRGRLYGLEEAVRLAQETECSSCRDAGATLGCFVKGCPRKYHYICALHSDCVLNEDNFSMKCTKHKTKLKRGSADDYQNAR